MKKIYEDERFLIVDQQDIDENPCIHIFYGDKAYSERLYSLVEKITTDDMELFKCIGRIIRYAVSSGYREDIEDCIDEWNSQLHMFEDILLEKKENNEVIEEEHENYIKNCILMLKSKITLVEYYLK